MTRIEQLERENAALRKILKSSRGGRRSEARCGDVRQLDLPTVRRFPLAEFAAGRGKSVPLPEVVQEIAEVVGREKAVRLVEGVLATGKRSWRRNLYVPSRMRSDHRIAKLIGLDAARALSLSHANSNLQLPPCKALRSAYLTLLAQKMGDDGATISEIAQELGVDQKTVTSLLDNAEYWAERLVD